MTKLKLQKSGRRKKRLPGNTGIGLQLAAQGNECRKQGRLTEAINKYHSALHFIPNNAGIYNNLGNAQKDLGRLNEALASYRRAIEIDPELFASQCNLGIILNKMEDYARAIDSLQKALEIDPGNAVATYQLAVTRAKVCDWTKTDMSNLGLTKTSSISPDGLLHYQDEPETHLVRAQNYSKAKFSKYFQRSLSRECHSGPLRIGYFSADFHNHATMYLMSGVFRLHDKKRFQISAYSYGPNANDQMRSNLIRYVDIFHDIRELDNQQVIEIADREKLDIAVDLKGYTQGQRLSLFAQRLAPIQMTWLGYPGTTGSDFMDYLIADPFVIPQNSRKYYSEKIAYLPNSYQPNDNKRIISNQKTNRKQFGLPSAGFVYCCFNKNQKITRREFDIWARLLRSNKDSVLWLFRSNKWAEANLRNEAASRGVEPDRLIFAERLPHSDHLARIRHADLFLDTFNYNAHTTASDALWAGLPVLTKAGRGFPARVAGSLLTSVGLNELIASSDDEYESIAINLSSNNSLLNAIKNKLAKRKMKSNLFNTEKFVSNLELLYKSIAKKN